MMRIWHMAWKRLRFDIYIAFENEFKNNINIEIFISSMNQGFSQETAQTVRLDADQKSVIVPIGMKEEVTAVRVDVMEEQGAEFNLAGIHLDTRQPKSILDYFYLPYFVGYFFVLALGTFVGLKFGKRIKESVRKLYYTNNENFIMFGVWGILILAVFGVFLIGKYKLTVTATLLVDRLLIRYGLLVGITIVLFVFEFKRIREFLMDLKEGGK